MSFDGDGNCELGHGCYKKRLRVPPTHDGTPEGELPTWKNCPCALIMHPVVWRCPIGNGCQFGFFGNAEQGTLTDCGCRTRCVRCLKGERYVDQNSKLEPGLLCAKCCHDLYDGIVRKQGKKFYKMYQSGVMEAFDETIPRYSMVSEKTVNACGYCLQELYDAAKADRYEL